MAFYTLDRVGEKSDVPWRDLAIVKVVNADIPAGGIVDFPPAGWKDVPQGGRMVADGGGLMFTVRFNQNVYDMGKTPTLAEVRAAGNDGLEIVQPEPGFCLCVRENPDTTGQLQWDIRRSSGAPINTIGLFLTAMSFPSFGGATGTEFDIFPLPKFPNGASPATERALRDGMRAGGGLIQYGQETGGEQRVDRIVFGDGAVQQVRRGIDVVLDRYQFLLAGPLRLLQKGDRRPHIKENREFLDDHIRGTKEGEFWIVHPDDHLLVSGEEDVRLVKVRVPAPHVPSVTITGYNYARMSVILERIR